MHSKSVRKDTHQRSGEETKIDVRVVVGRKSLDDSLVGLIISGVPHHLRYSGVLELTFSGRASFNLAGFSNGVTLVNDPGAALRATPAAHQRGAVLRSAWFSHFMDWS